MGSIVAQMPPRAPLKDPRTCEKCTRTFFITWQVSVSHALGSLSGALGCILTTIGPIWPAQATRTPPKRPSHGSHLANNLPTPVVPTPFGFPRFLLGDDAAARARHMRVENLLGPGLVMDSDFSGRRCAEAGARMQLRGCRVSGLKVSEDRVVMWCGSDVGKRQLSLLMDSDTVHVLPGVDAHLPDEVVAQLEYSI